MPKQPVAVVLLSVSDLSADKKQNGRFMRPFCFYADKYH
ncbi:hypothetical protein CSB69_1766 [Morganella morganii]|nr:hypothetical protein CSB69_1766 [Morganella morganii]EMP53653.1 hypothetical protein C790_00169 [Morganella morganii SC01]